MKFPFSLVRLSILFSFFLTLASTNAFSDDIEEIRVVGQKLNDAMSAGDYYTIGRLYAEMRRVEWQREMNARQSQDQTASPPKINNKENIKEKCKADAIVEESLCLEAAKHAYSDNVHADCITVTRGGVDLGPIGSVGGYRQSINHNCIEAKKAIRDAHISSCKTDKAINDRRCLN